MKKQNLLWLLLCFVVIGIASCKKIEKILIDGSSTVYPISEAMAEEYQKQNSSQRVLIGVSGTGGGFKKFCAGETDISNASRSIKSTEVDLCAKNGIEYLELMIGYDGLAVVTNKASDKLNSLTVEQLRSIFQETGYAKSWDEVNPAFPNNSIVVYSPGHDSGTYDYFTEVILGKGKGMRSDVTFSEDDNVLVTGISGEKNSIGFFGLAYYTENSTRLKLISVVNPSTKKAVLPTLQTVQDGSYSPLSRPLFIYARKDLKDEKRKSNLKTFLTFYLTMANQLIPEVGYIPLQREQYKTMVKKVHSEL